LTTQDKDKAANTRRGISDQFHKTPLYTQTKTSKHIQQKAECLLQQQMKQIDNYKSIRVDENTWFVLRSTTPKTESPSILPLFSRIRKVTVDENGQMQCDCGFTSRNGIPDRHIGHVACKYGIDFQSFCHGDIDVRYHIANLSALKIPPS
jgi:hypothetical protein